MIKIKQISRAKLERLYRTLTVRELCAHLGVTVHTLYNAIDNAGIDRKRLPYKEAVALKVVD